MQRAATMPEVPWGTPALEEQRRGSPAERAAVERAPSGALSAEDQNGPEDDDSDISDHQRHRERPKRGMLQGRFSGRLLSKSCEKSLAAECKLLGPLLGGVGKRGERSRMTLAKIVRAVAAGDVRRFCEEREGLIQVGICQIRVCLLARIDQLAYPYGLRWHMPPPYLSAMPSELRSTAIFVPAHTYCVQLVEIALLIAACGVAEATLWWASCLRASCPTDAHRSLSSAEQTRGRSYVRDWTGWSVRMRHCAQR